MKRQGRPAAAGADVRVERMSRRHLRAVHRIEVATNPHPWTLALFASELRQRSTRVYRVATASRRVIGYAGLILLADEGHVTNVGVIPPKRRHGVATRLLGEVFTDAVERGARSLTLEVRASNEAAQALYRRFGFCDVGRRRGYYSDNGEDAVIMTAADVDTRAFAARVQALIEAAERPTDAEVST